MKSNLMKTAAMLLLGTLVLCVFCAFTACKKADAPLAECGLEKVSRDGSEYYRLTNKKGLNCLVRTNCDLTRIQAETAAAALSGDGEAVIEKLIYANSERTYLFCMKAAPEGKASDDDRVVLILEKDGDGWKTAETVPYAMAQSLFEQLVKETADQREFTNVELVKGATRAEEQAHSIPGEAGSMYGFDGHIVVSGGNDVNTQRPEGRLIVSSEFYNIVYNEEESNRILAEVLYQRCAEKDADCSPAVCRAVLLASVKGFSFFVISAPGHDSISPGITSPLKPFLITRDETTGEITCEFLADVTYVPLG